MVDTEERAKELQRQYLREWRKRNKDKMQQYRKNYWLKKARSEGQYETMTAQRNGGEQK